MKTIAFLAGAMGIALSAFAQMTPIEDTAVLSHRLVLTPNAVAVEDLQSFDDVPVLIRLSETAIEGFSYEDFKSAGKDLIITDETGAYLPYEIETWNPEGESLVWTKVPRLSSDTQLTAYYGGEGEWTANEPEQVWSAYAGVWHFDDDVGSTNNLVNSSPTTYTGEAKGGSAIRADGVMGNHVHCRESGADGGLGITFPGTSAIRYGGNLTLSVWTKRNAVGGGAWDHLFYHKSRSSEWGNFCSELYGQDMAYGQISILGGGANGEGRYIAHGITETNTWYHVMLTYAGQDVAFYNNGVKMGGGSMPRAIWFQNGHNFVLGNNTGLNGVVWNGDFDEFRIYIGTMDEDRAALEYQAMATNALSCKATTNALTRPMLTTPTVARGTDGSFSVSVALTNGVATSVKAILNGSLEYELAPNGAANDWSRTFKLTGLDADTIYALKVKAVNNDDYVSIAYCPEVFYTGSISVVKVADAREEKLVPGALMFSRADTPAATAFDLPIAYTVGGTAAAGEDYVALPGTLTIPARQASVTIPVTPLGNVWTDVDVALDVTIDAGLYTASATSASVTIFNCRNTAMTGFTKRTVITFPEYDFDETLSGFPVLVRLSEKPGVFSYTNAPGATEGGILFMDGAGNVLPHEIDAWDAEGESLIWVRLNELKRGTEIMMLYGGTKRVANTPADVWDGYVGVWHLNETGEGANVAIADSSAHQLHGTTPTNPDRIDVNGNKPMEGKIGGARKISTTGGPAELGRILVPNNEAQDLYTGRVATMSIWFRLAGSEAWGYLMDRKARDDWDTWGLQFGGSSGVTKFRFYTESGNKNEIDFGSPLTQSEWHHVVAIWDYAKQSLYIDGVEIARDRAGNWIQDQKARNLALGGLVNDSGTSAGYGVFPGDLDEARLSGSARSAAWAITEYNTVATAEFATLSRTDALQSDRPAVDYAVLGENGKTVFFTLAGGKGNVFAIVRALDGSVTTNLVASNATAPLTIAVPLASLPQQGWIDIRVLAKAVTGTAYDERDWSMHVYNNPRVRQVRYTVDNYTGDAVTNFPALARVSSEATDGFTRGLVYDQETGKDIWFTDGLGQELPFELDTQDLDGESLYWVKMPTLRKGAFFYLNFGSKARGEADDADARTAARMAVWSGMAGVWHQSPIQTPDSGVIDANSVYENSHAFGGWYHRVGFTHTAAGAIGTSRCLSHYEAGGKHGSFVVNNNDYLDLGDAFTISGWFKYYNAGQTTGYDRLFSRKSAYNADNGWEVTLLNWDANRISIRGASSDSNDGGHLATPINDGAWHFLTIIYAGPTVTAYENGERILDNGALSAVATDNDLNLGVGDNSNRDECTFKGAIDEIRYSVGALSADRVKADYETVMNTDFFRTHAHEPGFYIIIK
ncbi:MAG: DUF2341 domain-containing protein [Kiritimatiellia bacterium]|jgi:hypothetical protein